VTLEDVLEIVASEQPEGVIVQYGGQTPLKLARDLEAAGVPIIGTSPDAIDRAEDRERFQQLIHELGLLQPPNTTVRSVDEASRRREDRLPLVVRPSYVLGGRAMEIVYRRGGPARYMRDAVSVSEDSPVLLDRFLTTPSRSTSTRSATASRW
jgi:carbamoyl-phosphate synthase large subunit